MEYLYLIYGMCFMFYSMMMYFFWNKRTEKLSRIVIAFLALILLQCIKDLFFMAHPEYNTDRIWMIMTSMDMVAVPFYVFILKELCMPGSVSGRTIALHITPFALTLLAFIISGNNIFFILEISLTAVYGFSYAIYTIFAIKRYHTYLRQCFSYEKNINLNWLKAILFSFFGILSLWIIDCTVINIGMECMYMSGSLVLWIFLCYFIYRHECVIDELNTFQKEQEQTKIQVTGSEQLLQLQNKIQQLFDEKQVYLMPNLKLSDITSMVGSNRTYVSKFFNNEQNESFFDFVNRYRVEHAVNLLLNSNEKVDNIVELSGFNSRQTFYRAFAKHKGMSPAQFRAKHRTS